MNALFVQLVDVAKNEQTAQATFPRVQLKPKGDGHRQVGAKITEITQVKSPDTFTRLKPG